jgi:hypothetical protein
MMEFLIIAWLGDSTVGASGSAALRSAMAVIVAARAYNNTATECVAACPSSRTIKYSPLMTYDR